MISLIFYWFELLVARFARLTNSWSVSLACLSSFLYVAFMCNENSCPYFTLYSSVYQTHNLFINPTVWINNISLFAYLSWKRIRLSYENFSHFISAKAIIIVHNKYISGWDAKWKQTKSSTFEESYEIRLTELTLKLQ